MEIAADFPIPLPPDEAYRLLLDLDVVVPCMPGATLGDATDDGGRRVAVAVKLGPMKMNYEGTVRVVEGDPAARRAVLEGQARETRGQGNARATITMTVTATEEGSRAEAIADIALSGRAATMGRGVVQDVSRRLIADMAASLEDRLSTSDSR
jgi:uncharacterized protein